MALTRLEDEALNYDCQCLRSRLWESSAVGAGLGLILAFIAAIGIRIPDPVPVSLPMLGLVLLMGSIGGVGFGAILDWIMGYGIQEADLYLQGPQITHLLQQT